MRVTRYSKSEVFKSSIKYVGTEYNHKQYGTYMVIDYINNKRVKVIFERTGHEAWISLQAAKNSVVQDPLQPSLHGIARLGISFKEYPREITKKAYRSYVNMIERVYVQESNTYQHCDVAEPWLTFENYKPFFCEDPWRQEGWQLDKDLLVYGNKTYSPDTCVFLPAEINITMTTYHEQRREIDRYLPPGVSYCFNQNRRYRIHKSAACMEPPIKTIEYFFDPKEAYREYKRFKESIWKYLADKWEGKVDPRAIKALREREFFKGEYNEWLQ